MDAYQYLKLLHNCFLLHVFSYYCHTITLICCQQLHNLKTIKLIITVITIGISESKTPELSQSSGSVPTETEAAPGIRIL
jgi:hypothetical protein